MADRNGGLSGGMAPQPARPPRSVAGSFLQDEIGAALGIASKTVEAHLRRLFDRLGLQSRTELATRAIREGWLGVP